MAMRRCAYRILLTRRSWQGVGMSWGDGSLEMLPERLHGLVADQAEDRHGEG